MAPRRTLLLTVGAVAVLSATGSALAPSWQRPPLIDNAGFAALPAAPRPPVAGDGFAPASVDLSVPVAGTTLNATLYAPAGARARPAVVLVAGGGPATRAGLSDQAEWFARAGIVALVYDKRTVGYSFVRRDYGQLADDAVAMVRLLRTRPEVDPGRVGLWGVSEGGWVVPLAAAREPAVAFAILVNAPTTSPGAQLSWAIDDGLRRQHAPAGARRFAARGMALGGTGYTDYDPLPALRALRAPVLALYGTHDRAVPPAQSARVLVDAITGAGNPACVVRFLAGADHGMKVAGRYADGYLDTMAWWIDGLPASAAAQPRIAGAVPVQADAASVPPVPPYGRAPAIAAAYATVVAGYVVAVLAARRVRRRAAGPMTSAAAIDGGRAGVWRAVRRTVRWGAGTAVGINVGLGALVGLGFVDAPAAASHGVWLLLRAGAVGTVAAAAVATGAVLDARRAGWHPDRAAKLGLAGVGVGTAAVLGLAAYWELFAARW